MKVDLAANNPVPTLIQNVDVEPETYKIIGDQLYYTLTEAQTNATHKQTLGKPETDRIIDSPNTIESRLDFVPRLNSDGQVASLVFGLTQLDNSASTQTQNVSFSQTDILPVDSKYKTIFQAKNQDLQDLIGWSTDFNHLLYQSYPAGSKANANEYNFEIHELNVSTGSDALLFNNTK